ncbi:MAG: hypothetical protein WAK82_38335 [Streptosporangiaceae bacterium]
MAQVRFCDVAGLRIILGGGDGQQPAPAQVTLHNLLPHLDKLVNLLAGDPAPDLAAGAAGRFSTGHPDQAARPRDEGNALTLAGTPDEPGTSPPAARAEQRIFPGRRDAARPETRCLR